MKRYEVLEKRELFPGSDIVRSFGYRAAASGDNYGPFEGTDCFVRCSPCDWIRGKQIQIGK